MFHLHLYSLLSIENPFPVVRADPNKAIPSILAIVYGIVGAMSFLFIVIGGFKYVISRGDPQATARAKDTIIYAAIGLAIVLSAATITNFVFGRI